MSHIFGNKIYHEPGSAARVVTNVAPTPNLLSAGVVGLIGECDGGLTFQDGIVYEYTNPNSLKAIMRGGVSHRLVDMIFNPSVQTPGAQRIMFVRAQQATKATAVITDATPDPDDVFTMTTIDKGLYLSDATNGLKWKLIAGTVDTDKHILQLQFQQDTIWSSPEISTFNELIAAIAADTFASSFITSVLTSGDGDNTISTGTRTASFAVFSSGTSPSMTGTDIDSALALLQTKGVNFVFVASETNTNHAKALSFCNTMSETPCLTVCGGAASETKAQAIARAAALNDQNAILCWPGIKVPNVAGTAIETLSPMYHAAMVTGLLAGLTPETPATWKRLNVVGFETPAAGIPSKTDREDLLKGGVLYSRNIPGVGFGVNKSINTLQTNGSMIYSTASGEAVSPEISITRIKHQLNRELEINSAPLFVGGTASNVSEEDVLNFTISYLQTRTSTPTQSNLINSFSNVTARLQDDAWFVEYAFVPNTPINHTFFTGAMLRP